MFFGEYDYDMDIAVQREEAYEDGLSAGEARGLAQGERTAKLETARNLLAMNLSVEQIARAVSLPVEEVLSLTGELKNEN